MLLCYLLFAKTCKGHLCVKANWKILEPINIIWIKCVELEAERSRWLNTKLNVALYNYPHFFPIPVFKMGDSSFPGKGLWDFSTPPCSSLFAAQGRSQHLREITDPLLTKQEQRRWRSPFSKPEKSFQDACTIDQVRTSESLTSRPCSGFPAGGTGQLELHSGSHFIILTEGAAALVQTCNSIVKNTGLAVPTGERCDAIEGSNAVHHAPLEGGPFC